MLEPEFPFPLSYRAVLQPRGPPHGPLRLFTRLAPPRKAREQTVQPDLAGIMPAMAGNHPLNYIQASQLTLGRGRRGRRAAAAVRNQDVRCRWRAAQASMAQEMPRSSCLPARQV